MTEGRRGAQLSDSDSFEGSSLLRISPDLLRLLVRLPFLPLPSPSFPSLSRVLPPLGLPQPAVPLDLEHSKLLPLPSRALSELAPALRTLPLQLFTHHTPLALASSGPRACEAVTASAYAGTFACAVPSACTELLLYNWFLILQISSCLPDLSEYESSHPFCFFIELTPITIICGFLCLLSDSVTCL